MNIDAQMPITHIGELDWIAKLSLFLNDHDVEVVALKSPNLISETANRLDWKIPQSISDYYLNFGGIESSDFMYNLQSLQTFEYLDKGAWEFIFLYFKKEETKNFISFSKSPANDPLCINKESNEIYLFSHDPIKKQKVFKNFNDYLLNEIIDLKKLFIEISFNSEEDEIMYKSKVLNGEGIDYGFRFMKI